MTPLSAAKALDTFFHDTRSRILDIAATLDRLNRGGDSSSIAGDPRVKRIREALDILLDESGGRAERIQKIFSLEYDANWDKPTPRY